MLLLDTPAHHDAVNEELSHIARREGASPRGRWAERRVRVGRALTRRFPLAGSTRPYPSVRLDEAAPSAPPTPVPADDAAIDLTDDDAKCIIAAVRQLADADAAQRRHNRTRQGYQSAVARVNDATMGVGWTRK